MKRRPATGRSRQAVVAILACGAIAVSGCARSTDHERIGDRRYGEGAWSDAVAEYRMAARQRRATPELLAKLGGAALRGGQLQESVRAWRELAASDAAARGEAAEGLLRTARRAAAGRDPRVLRIAVAALRDLAPERLPELGPLLILALDPASPAQGDDDLLFQASAHSGRAVADSLLVLWADIAVRSGRCAAAVPVYETVMRRGTAAMARGSRGGLAACRVEAGRVLLAQGLLEEAEEAFRSALALGSPDSTMRLAWLLIGDARWSASDSTGAAAAYGNAVQGGDQESAIVQRAEDQLRRLLMGNQIEP